MNIAICDFVQQDRSVLSTHIRKFCFEQLWDCSIDEFCSCDELQASCAQKAYHMIYIDLYHWGIKGLECASNIRKLDADVVIVFLTELETYFQEGYELGVRGYLVKPIEESCVRSSIRRNSKYILNRSLTVLSENSAVKIPEQDILYIENINGNSVIHTKEFLIKTYASLEDLAKRLDTPKFIRCHSSYIVNLDAILKLNIAAFQLRNGEQIPVSMPMSKREVEKYLLIDEACINC